MAENATADIADSTKDAVVERSLATLAETEAQIRRTVRTALYLLAVAGILLLGLAWGVYALMERRAALQSDIAHLTEQKKALEAQTTQLSASFNEASQQKSDETAEKDVLKDKLDKVDTALAEKGTASVAIAQAKEVLAPSSPSARSLWLQGYSAYRSGNRTAAKKYYENAHALDPKYAPPLNSLGRIASDEGNSAQAIALYKQALEADPNYLPALSNLAVSDLASGNLDEANAMATKANTLRPGYTKPVLDEIAARKRATTQ